MRGQREIAAEHARHQQDTPLGRHVPAAPRHPSHEPPLLGLVADAAPSGEVRGRRPPRGREKSGGIWEVRRAPHAPQPLARNRNSRQQFDNRQLHTAVIRSRRCILWPPSEYTI